MKDNNEAKPVAGPKIEDKQKELSMPKMMTPHVLEKPGMDSLHSGLGKGMGSQVIKEAHPIAGGGMSSMKSSMKQMKKGNTEAKGVGRSVAKKMMYAAKQKLMP